MKIGKYTYGDPNIHRYLSNNDADLTIGKFCSIGSNVKIYLGGNHRIDRVTTYPFGHIHKDTFNTFNGSGHPATKGDVIIGNDVWIGENATIMSGVRIGDGAVIANNSHVVKDVEPYSLVEGNPAKFIKYRFTKEQMDNLLLIKWWDWDDDKINKHCRLLCNDRIDEFIEIMRVKQINNKSSSKCAFTGKPFIIVFLLIYIVVIILGFFDYANLKKKNFIVFLKKFGF
jgi:acetyltransferase-like isoleucine patch superfamily enzyme